ncbi:hypothetical protein [Agrobacterium rosae]|uniref:Uncharacterized protein n=1 Tax=Agrobacterium rosae TaxID=1972867 RepID=A0AAE5RTR7_9HYPH|nr:hypothetical protein [Agrobacterium rosae]KAA3511599.1 hypothetical protein DXM21_14230 [Agrobacterium rosae]KAA3518977.1 hypothetical protein DXM25_13785 [Agrobacterium rosae]MQB49295.1 hypothetical protein [Agrobacterium rosae]POO49137.1 hypothetical protein CPJ18_22055 [Agrobacterium rosae]
MLSQIKSYAIIGAVILFIALSGAFGIYYKIASSQIDTLTASNATLSLTVALNEKTIDQMKLDAETLSKSIVELNKTNRVIEDNFAKEWSAIDQMDALSEDQANSSFAQSIKRLKAATQPK